MTDEDEGGVDRRFRIEGLPTPPGPFAWTTGFGGMLFVSGIRGIDPATGAPVPTDEERIDLIFAHLAVNAAYERTFGAELPTRTIVEVHALNQGDTIELEAIAARRRG